MKNGATRRYSSTGICSILVFVLFLITMLSPGCINQQPEYSDNGHLTIVTTILPLSEFVTRVGGQYVTCQVMIPPGASPHTFEMTPRQMQIITDADLYVMVGSGIEFEEQWMERLQAINPDMKIINASAGLTFIPWTGNPDTHQGWDDDGVSPTSTDSSDRHDPHVWLSLTNARDMVREISAGLCEVDPIHASYYANNRDLYFNQLQLLDQIIDETMANKSVSVILVTHPSFGYFCRDYGIRQLAIEEDGKEPTPGDLKNLVQTARANALTVIFAEPEYSDAGARAVAQETGAKVVMIDPLSEEYLKNMKLIAEAFSGNNVT